MDLVVRRLLGETSAQKAHPKNSTHVGASAVFFEPALSSSGYE